MTLLATLGGCCEETDFDVGIERGEMSPESCLSVCRNWADYRTDEDLYYEVHGCGEGESEDGRPLVICHVTEVDCRSNNHF